MIIIGLDPGLRTTGWGVIDARGNNLHHIAHGAVSSVATETLAERLRQIHIGVLDTISEFLPAEAAVEETFVNKNPASTLLLGQARGAVMLAPALAGIPVSEYAANLIKKSLVGVGHADKKQVRAMVRVLVPGADVEQADAADALAVAICHAHHRSSPITAAGALAAAGARA